MHGIDERTEQMIRSVLAYAEERLRMNPVPLDKGLLSADELYERLGGLIGDKARSPDDVNAEPAPFKTQHPLFDRSSKLLAAVRAMLSCIILSCSALVLIRDPVKRLQ